MPFLQKCTILKNLINIFIHLRYKIHYVEDALFIKMESY